MNDLVTLSNQIQNKQISPVEIMKELFHRIGRANPTLNAFVTLLEEQALEEAHHAEREIVSGLYRGPLHGVPIGIKDMIYTKGIRTTLGSKAFTDFIPEDDAVVVENLKKAGGIMIGKCHTHEFAYGPTGDRSFFGPARNPWNTNKMPGGSSSGSAVAVAAGLCYGAVGTDTGGSVRIPSACCGVVGMKPTLGRVSKAGVYPLSYTLDHVGPITRTVKDNAVLLGAMVGYDAKDPSSSKTSTEDFTQTLNDDIKGTTIGIPSSYFFDSVNPEVLQAVENAIAIFKQLGVEIRVVEVPNLEKIAWAQPIIQKSEAYAIHEATLRNHADDLDPEVKERLIESGNEKGHEYVNAIRFREKAVFEAEQLFENIDVLLTPTLPILPPDIDQRNIEIDGKTETVRSMLLRNTSPWNYTGHPSLSVPCGFSKDNLPIGVQLVGPYHGEAQVYRFGYWLEQQQL